MNVIRLTVVGLILLGRVPLASAQSELPAAAKEVLKQFEEETAEIHKKAEADVQKRSEKTAVELKKVQDLYCKEAKLDEAVAVRDLIRSLRAGTNRALSRNLPAAAREIYKQHAEEVAEIGNKAEAEARKRQEKIAVELKKVQDHFCKQAKLDEAVAVRDLIRSIRDGVTRALPDPGYVNNQTADIGKVFYYQVTGTTAGQSIYGTDVYTTGSHLGMAAAHCGLLKNGQRGVVKVTILPGQARYTASTRNGVTSYGYGQWGVSFKVERVYGFVRKQAANVQPDPGTLTGFQAQVGQSLLFEVTGSNTGSIWGTEVYTDDSNLATAAVHAGILAAGQKGVVRVYILPGQESYPNTTKNGIASGSWGNWTGSFRVEPVR
jgi:LCCL domain